MQIGQGQGRETGGLLLWKETQAAAPSSRPLVAKWQGARDPEEEKKETCRFDDDDDDDLLEREAWRWKQKPTQKTVGFYIERTSKERGSKRRLHPRLILSPLAEKETEQRD